MAGSGQPRVPLTTSTTRTLLCPFDPNHEVPDNEFSRHIEEYHSSSQAQSDDLIVCHYNFAYFVRRGSPPQAHSSGTSQLPLGPNVPIVLPWSAYGPPRQIVLPWSVVPPQFHIRTPTPRSANPGYSGGNVTAADQIVPAPRQAPVDELDMMEAGFRGLNFAEEDMEFDGNL